MLFSKFGAVSARFYGLLLFISIVQTGNLVAQGNCQCTNCPQFMQDNFIGSFLINVQNAANPTLGQNGQGVCGVSINFDHEYLGDLSITLTSPGGQSVTLVGPIGLFGETDGSSWNVNFVPCADPADPDPGFNAQWNNNQPWGLNGTYVGSYYPSNGCLENFNMGPVNGTWTLTVVDGQANDVGNFLDYEIIFCDPSGIDCFSCAASAGELPQPDVSACEGNPTLDLELSPTYTAANPAAPMPEYAYTYIISGPGGVILDYDPNSDLSSYPPGIYSVCGMSYLAAQEPLIPAPNGALTVNQLRTMLNSGTAPFCGKITTNCVNVTINAVPEDVEIFAEICAPQCYVFNGISRCASGTYTANLVQNGCPYTSTLYLTVGQPRFTTLVEYICDGGCSSNPTFPGACATGSYQEVLQTWQGCDSTVTLNITTIAVQAAIANQPTIPCGGGTVQLSGTGSSSGGYTYLWTASNGGNIVGPTSQINANVNAAGDYQIKVCRSIAGVTCCDSAQVTIDAATAPPNAPTQVNGLATLCQGQSFNYNIAPVNGASSYTWTVPTGVTINSGGASLVANVTWGSATGGQVCVTANNGCGESDPTCLDIAVNTAPTATVPQGSNSVCAGNNSNYSIPVVTNATTYTWTIDAPAQIISGQGTNAVQVAWNGATSANLCVTTNNTCGISAQQCLPITIGSTPAAPVVSGPAAACTQATDSYTIAPIAGATSYVWTVTGGTITAGNGTTTAQVTWNNNATSGVVCVKSTNSCGESTETCFNVSLSAPPAQPSISGDNALCPGDTATYTATTVAGAMGYVWTPPAGATVLSGQGTSTVTIVFGTAPGGNVGVAVNGSCGTAPQVVFPVTVNPFPVPNAGADIIQCGSIATLNGSGGSGVWAQISGAGNTVFANNNMANTNVTAPQNGLYAYEWIVNALGCIASDTVMVNFETLPNAGGITILCDAANENYTVSFPINGGQSPFTISGGTVVNGVFTSAPIVSGQNYLFNITDANNCPSPVIQGTHNCSCATNAGSMSLMPLQACGTATVTATQQTPPTLDGNDIGAFILHEGSGSTIVNSIGQNATGEFGFQAGMIFGQTYYISYAAGNNIAGLPSPTDPCFSVTQGQPVTFFAIPVADAGTVLINCGNTITLNASGSGVWSVANAPTNGQLQFTNNNDPVTSVSTSVFGTYTLQWDVSANGCTATDQTDITFNPTPLVANIDRICDPTNQFYTVIFDINGGTAPYIIDGATLSDTAYISAPFSNGQTYNLTISDSEGCTTTAVAGSFACNCATDAGTMNNAPLKACATQTVQAAANNDANLDGNDIVAFILHDAPGTVAGTILDQNTTGVFGFLPGMVLGQTYYISRIAGNPAGGTVDPTDPCFSVAAGQEVVFLEIPSPDAGLDNALCGTVANLAGTPSAFSGVWTFVSGPSVANIATPTALNSEIGVSQAGTYTFRWTATNDICTGFDETEIVFHPMPQAEITDEICNNTNTQYEIVVNVSGGATPYMISGLTGSFLGNTYTSGLLNNNTTYTFTVTDANGCTFGPLTGVKNCNCATDAGTMDIAPLIFCANEPAIATWNNDGQLDGNDMIQYVLHNGAGLSLGQVFAIAATPSFSFGGNLTIGQVYYISAVAGNNNNGVIDPTDPCLSISAGTPVQWKALPTASISGTATICEGGSTEIVFNGTGLYPLTVSWTEGSGAVQNTAIAGAQGAQVLVNPAATTIYTLSQVIDGGLPTCATDLNTAVTITVNQLAGAGIPEPSVAVCIDAPAIFQLADLLTGEDNGGVWTEVSNNPSSGAAFNASNGSFNTANQPAGTYMFRYTVSPVAPCPPDAAEVTVVVRPQPAADAGEDQVVDCNTPTVSIGGMGTGTGMSYQWYLAGSPIDAATQRFLEVSAGGVYQLEVTNIFGCTQTDEATVTERLEAPVFDQINKINISCYGEEDGTIEIVKVSGGTPPYLYAFNGGAFGMATQFGPLPAGNYTIEVTDINGCASVSDNIEVIEPAELLANLGADLIVKLGDTAHVALQLNTVNLSAIDTIIWTPLFDTLRVGMPSQSFMPMRSSMLEVLVRDTNGCTAQDRLEFGVDRRRNIYVPNIFYPSGSENNIVVIFGGNDVAEVKYFQIFDRWGDMVHETTNFQPGDLSKGWNGTIENRLAQPAVFVWTAAVLFKDGEIEVFTGDVTITR